MKKETAIQKLKRLEKSLSLKIPTKPVVFSKNQIRKHKKAEKRKIKIQKKIDYKKYIVSKAWYRKRAWMWNQRDHKCGVCKVELTLNSAVLHHRTYDRVGKELDTDLVFLCHDCHQRIHFTKISGKKKSLKQRKLVKEENKLKEYYENLENGVTPRTLNHLFGEN